MGTLLYNVYIFKNITCAGEVGLAVVVCRRCDLPFLSRLNDSRRDFLKDLRRDIGVSPAPAVSVNCVCCELLCQFPTRKNIFKDFT